MKLSVFPWIALELGPASLGNPPGFSDQPVRCCATCGLAGEAAAPCCARNWKSAASRLTAPRPAPVEERRGPRQLAGLRQPECGRPNPPPSPSSGSGSCRIWGVVEIKDSRVSYQDLVADHLNFELGHLTSGTPAPVKLKVALTPSQGRAADHAHQSVRSDTRHGEETVRGSAPSNWRARCGRRRPQGPCHTKFSAPVLSDDLTAQTLNAPNFKAQLASAALAGSLRGSRIVDAPASPGLSSSIRSRCVTS